jgi:hypothetical protein
MDVRICRVCKLDSSITKFIIKNNKIYGKRCCKCNIIANNIRLKNKQQFLYINKNNLNNNTVVFNFENKE